LTSSSQEALRRRLLTLILAVLAICLTASLPLYAFLFSEAPFSNAVTSWHSDFEKALSATGEVKLHSLVKFPSEKFTSSSRTIGLIRKPKRKCFPMQAGSIHFGSPGEEIGDIGPSPIKERIGHHS
jgi:hypothetical protein